MLSNSSFKADQRAKFGKWLMFVGVALWLAPLVMLALAAAGGLLLGFGGILAMRVLWPLGTLALLVGFVLFVARGKAGDAYGHKDF